MADGNKRFTITGGIVTDTQTGKMYEIDYSKVSGMFKKGTKNQLNSMLEFYLENGRPPTADEAKDLDYMSKGDTEGGDWENLTASLAKFVNDNNINELLNEPAPEDVEPTDPKEAAFNEYYKDLYSLEQGTQGRDILDNLERSYQNQASSASILADANYQAQALQQAQTVKNITDQVRAERMARLKAGMSEYQIANQDMQMLMANVNAANQNVQMMNQARLEAQLGMGLAKDQAYQEYLNQVNARGQVATGMYAADSGNLNYAVDNYLQKTYGTTNVSPSKRKAATQMLSGYQPK